MVPKGKLLIIGGAEERRGNDGEDRDDNEQHFEILKALLPGDKKQGRIEVITTASQKPEEMQEMYQKTFKEIGYTNVGFLIIDDKVQARDTAFSNRVEKAKVVFFTGGDQLRLSTIIAGTELASLIKKKYMEEKDFL